MFETVNALYSAAKYVTLYEEHSPRLPFHSAHLYQVFARELQNAARDDVLWPFMMDIAHQFPAVRSFVVQEALDCMITMAREQALPELHDCILNMTHTE